MFEEGEYHKARYLKRNPTSPTLRRRPRDLSAQHGSRGPLSEPFYNNIVDNFKLRRSESKERLAVPSARKYPLTQSQFPFRIAPSLSTSLFHLSSFFRFKYI